MTGHSTISENLHNAAIRTQAAAPGRAWHLAMALDDKNFFGAKLSS
jgi:hypothetical protein